MFCPSCGKENPDDVTFCRSCGASLKQSAPASASPSTSAPSSGPVGPKLPEVSLGKIPAGQATFTMRKAFSNAINLVKSPATFMRQNKDVSISIKDLLLNYVAVIAAIPFLATLIGDLWYHSSRFYGYTFAIAIGTYVLEVAGVFILGYIIWKLAPSFGTTTTLERATLVSAFVYTPVFLIGIVDIIPFISFLTILGLLYGLYILYIGLPIIQSTPSDKALVYTVVIVVAAIIIYAVIAVLLGFIAAAFVVSRAL